VVAVSFSHFYKSNCIPCASGKLEDGISREQCISMYLTDKEDAMQTT
jgi:hypothetical protein